MRCVWAGFGCQPPHRDRLVCTSFDPFLPFHGCRGVLEDLFCTPFVRMRQGETGTSAAVPRSAAVGFGQCRCRDPDPLLPWPLQIQRVYVFKKGSSAGRKEMKELVRVLAGSLRVVAALRTLLFPAALACLCMPASCRSCAEAQLSCVPDTELVVGLQAPQRRA